VLTRYFVAILVVACGLIGCAPTPPPESHSRTIIALGTVVTVDILGTDEDQAEPALDAVERYFQLIQREWYAFGDGELGKVNQALSRGNPAEMSPDLADLTRRSLALRDLSGGLFDPAVGMLVELWGFADTDAVNRAPPDDDDIQRWKDNSEHAAPRLVGTAVSADRPIKLTFGAVAKGTALNQACVLLLEMNIQNALVDAGGDLKVLGRRDARRWRIGIRNPRADGILGVIELDSGEAVVTSGDYERYFTHAGQTYHHLLDPRTGRPVADTAGVTVLHQDAELADAAATALMVAGADHFHEVARLMGIDVAMLVTTQGDIIMTPKMTARIREPVQNGGTEAGIM
jgi:thiamine biosynthesis lipoprotein